MRIVTSLFLAGLAVAVTAAPVLAFGRGGAAARSTTVSRGPAGGVTRSTAGAGVSTGPLGGTHASSVQGTTRQGPGGVTVQHATGATASSGPLGGSAAAAGSATRITGPGGQSYTHTQGGAARSGPLGGTQVSGGSRTSVGGPMGGGASVGHSGSVAVGPAGGVHASASSGAAVRGPMGGGAAVGSRTSVGIGPAGGARVGHSTAYWSAGSVQSSATVVRTGFRTPCFNAGWYSGHSTAWVAPRYYNNVSIWRPIAWTATAAFVGVTAAALTYDYGSTVVIQENNVYVNGTPVASVTDYTAQAGQIVELGRQAQPGPNDEWQPLGVFGLVAPGEQTAQRILQLAVNRNGVVRGNYYDTVTDTALPVVGGMDRNTQRVAWSIGDKRDVVFETGLGNLTQSETTALVHRGAAATDQLLLVRLEEPSGGPR